MAPAGFLGQGLRHRAGELRRHLRTDAVEPLGLAALDGGEDRGLVIPRERPPAGEHLVQQHAQRPEIGPAVHRLAARLLG